MVIQYRLFFITAKYTLHSKLNQLLQYIFDIIKKPKLLCILRLFKKPNYCVFQVWLAVPVLWVVSNINSSARAYH